MLYQSRRDRRRAELERYFPSWFYAFNSEIEADRAASNCYNSILDRIEGLRGQARNDLLSVLVLHIALPGFLDEIDFPAKRVEDLSIPLRELLAEAICSYRASLDRYSYIRTLYLRQRVPLDIVLDIELCEELEVE